MNIKEILEYLANCEKELSDMELSDVIVEETNVENFIVIDKVDGGDYFFKQKEEQTGQLQHLLKSGVILRVHYAFLKDKYRLHRLKWRDCQTPHPTKHTL